MITVSKFVSNSSYYYPCSTTYDKITNKYTVKFEDGEIKENVSRSDIYQIKTNFGTCLYRINLLDFDSCIECNIIEYNSDNKCYLLSNNVTFEKYKQIPLQNICFKITLQSDIYLTDNERIENRIIDLNQQLNKIIDLLKTQNYNNSVIPIDEEFTQI